MKSQGGTTNINSVQLSVKINIKTIYLLNGYCYRLPKADLTKVGQLCLKAKHYRDITFCLQANSQDLFH